MTHESNGQGPEVSLYSSYILLNLLPDNKGNASLLPYQGVDVFMVVVCH
jgi:hypothetical protein